MPKPASLGARDAGRPTSLPQLKSVPRITKKMIAATAVVHCLTVVTRNVRDYRQFAVALLSPFEG